jgi:hypothetical protein
MPLFEPFPIRVATEQLFFLHELQVLVLRLDFVPVGCPIPGFLLPGERVKGPAGVVQKPSTALL